MKQYILDTPIAPVTLIASQKGLCRITWFAQKGETVRLSGAAPEVKHLMQAAEQLNEYFEGRRTEFDLITDVEGTPFQKTVWAELVKIPFGRTVSYGDIARTLRKSGAVRAVGTANGKNPLSIIVPCHRVIQANGTLGGYSGTLAVKRKLLDFESAQQGLGVF